MTLSLNKRDPLDGGEQNIAELGLVSGDLIHVLSACDQHGALKTDQKLHLATADSNSLLSRHDSPSQSAASDASPLSTDASLTTNARSKMDGIAGTSGGAENNSIEDSTTESNRCGELPMDTSSDSIAANHSSADRCAGESEPHVMAADEQKIVNRYLNEPMVVRESTDHVLPQTLVLACSVVQPQTPDAALMVLLDVLMSELGYELITEGETQVDWNLTTGATTLNYRYPQLPDVKFQLLCVRMISVIVVHGLVRLSANIIEKRTRLQLKTFEFVQPDTAGSLMYRGGRLAQLSRVFKDTVAYPMLQFAMEDNGEMYLPTLTTLVYELKVHIMKYLNVGSLVQLSAVSQSLRAVALQPVLWRRLYAKDFGRRADMNLNQDWLSLYKEAYSTRKKVRHAHARIWDSIPPPVPFPFPFMGPSFPDYPPTFPGVPSGFIVGGEYDLRPTLGPDPLRLPDPTLRLPHRLAPEAVFDPTTTAATTTLEHQLPSVMPASVVPPPGGRAKTFSPSLHHHGLRFF